MQNIRKNLIFFCGIDGCRFNLTSGRYSLYYRCPRYESIHRKNTEKACMNRLSPTDLEILYSIFEEYIESNSLTTGLHDNYLHLEYKVTDINEFYIKVFVINKRFVKK